MHELSVESDFLTPGWIAFCSCGWQKDVDTAARAVDEWENHCDLVFMEATMSGACDD